MPRPGLPLVHFNDSCCGSAAKLRSIILKARRLTGDHAEQERVAAAAKAWLLAQIEKKARAVTEYRASSNATCRAIFPKPKPRLRPGIRMHRPIR